MMAQDNFDQEVYFIRHGETEYNRRHIIQGRGVDIGLNATGRKQAMDFYRSYMDEPFELLISSSLKRSRETIEPFLAHQIPYQQHAEIDEISWGDYEGRKSDPGMRAVYSDILQSWKRGDLERRIPGGESAEDLARRLNTFLDFLRTRPEEKILVCSHGRAMRCLMCLVSGFPVREMDRFQHANTGLYLVKRNHLKYHIVKENDTSHLKTAMV